MLIFKNQEIFEKSFIALFTPKCNERPTQNYLSFYVNQKNKDIIYTDDLINNFNFKYNNENIKQFPLIKRVFFLSSKKQIADKIYKSLVYQIVKNEDKGLGVTVYFQKGELNGIICNKFKYLLKSLFPIKSGSIQKIVI